MSKESIFLLLAAVGLTPIALSYGVSPGASITYLYDFDASSVNAAHIFRAIMGLYLAMVVFWVCGAKQESLKGAALWSVIIFMWGLAAGRALSLVVDGMPDPLLVIYLVLEFGIGAVGLIFVRGLRQR